MAEATSTTENAAILYFVDASLEMGTSQGGSEMGAKV